MIRKEDGSGYYLYRALGERVIAVASINERVGDWTAYIGDVPGAVHGHEWRGVAKRGAKLDHVIALAIFPEIGLANAQATDEPGPNNRPLRYRW